MQHHGGDALMKTTVGRVSLRGTFAGARFGEPTFEPVRHEVAAHRCTGGRGKEAHHFDRVLHVLHFWHVANDRSFMLTHLWPSGQSRGTPKTLDMAQMD